MKLPEVYPVTCHTDRVGQGSTFVAIQGFTTDGALHVQQALAKGATRVVVQQSAPLVSLVQEQCSAVGVPCDVVADARYELAVRSLAAWGNPEKKLSIVGVTGTKGKSTTTWLLRHILASAGHRVALVGTITNSIVDQPVLATRTTPESDELAALLAMAVAAGCTHAVLEVSSHALTLSRVAGILFTAVGFTNLASDHLDFHGTMEDYFAAKCRIFAQLIHQGAAVVNVDDTWGKKAAALVADLDTKLVAVAQVTQQQPAHPGDYRLLQNTVQHGLTLQMPGGAVHTGVLFGSFNAANCAMAYYLAASLGLTHQHIAVGLASCTRVPGRLERIDVGNGIIGIVDYAHNAMALEALLQMLRPLTTDLIVVFGCGGNRDPGRRSGMGRVAAQYADKIVVTNDNPRLEDPQVIIAHIVSGIPAEHHHKVTVQPDRAQAIVTAVSFAVAGSLVVVAGKGHETTFHQGGRVTLFDDREVLRQLRVLHSV